jgi:hypothetical protein
MKPLLVAIATGTINIIMFIHIDVASEAVIGSNNTSVAVLLIISVGNV